MVYDREKSEIQLLRAHLLAAIPSTPLSPAGIRLAPDSIALRAAVAGLDKELARLEREERLVKRFSATNNEATGATAATADEKNVDTEYVNMTKEDAVMEGTGDDASVGEEWEDAAPTPPRNLQKERLRYEVEPTRATKGEADISICKKYMTELAAAAVARIAAADARARTPLGAIGLVLHAALVESTDQDTGKGEVFRCTGVPDANVIRLLVGTGGNGGGGGGFAPPIRELPQGVLLPPKWEEAEGTIAFRYNCGKGVYSVDSSSTNDATKVYLTLKLLQSKEGEEGVSVTFGTLPASSKDTMKTRKQLWFPLGQHVNLEGFAASKAKNGAAVQPALFYVSLAPLLAQFCSHFTVPPSAKRNEDAAVGMQVTSMHQTPAIEEMKVHPKSVPLPASGVPRGAIHDPLLVQRRPGDFEGDLLPGGPQPGGLHPVLPSGGGSHVGPDHPLFNRHFGDYEDHVGGGFGDGGGSLRLPGVGGGVGGMGMRPR